MTNRPSLKPKAQYSELGFLARGQSAWVYVITHPRFFGLIRTSKVLRVSADGKCFETLNTFYVPVSDPDAPRHNEELIEKETENG